MNDFHSAVNRIPVLRREAMAAAGRGELSPALFGEHAPTGQDRLHAERLTGTLDLEMIVRTPLVYGEQTCQSDGSSPEVKVPRDAASNPIMPPTMIKGMLSRAYELLTTSRFRVFGDTSRRQRQERTVRGHSEPLTYRAATAQATTLFPGRVLQIGDQWVVEILRGRSRNFRAALVADDAEKGAGKIIDRAGQDLPPGSAAARERLEEFRRATPHGSRVKVKIGLGSTPLVTHVWNKDLQDYEEFFQAKDKDFSDYLTTVGFTCRTAPADRHARHLFSTKVYERFFFSDDVEPSRLPLTAEHLERYQQVLQSYLDCHAAPGGRRNRLNRAALRLQRLQKRSTPPGAVRTSSLSHDDLVFVQLRDAQFYPKSGVFPPSTQVMDVLPTMVGRRPYRLSPAQLAESQLVQPLPSRAQASAADRLFGFVIPGVEPEATGAVGGDVAAQGRLKFGPVRISPPPGEEKAICKPPKPQRLVPLMAPKTTSARRFLTDAQGATPRKKGGPLARHEYFQKGQLLGAAAYPVHRTILNGAGLPARAVNVTEELGTKQDNPKVRLAVCDWLKPGTRMTCRVQFTDITAPELAALLWLLEPRNLVPPGANRRKSGFLRLGLGKPLGLGAVEVRLASDGLQLVDHQTLVENYLKLTGCLGTVSKVVDPHHFPLPHEEYLRTTPWVRALQRAAFGYSDNLPVRYMSLDENKANNQTDSRTGEPKPGCGKSPADLF
ncbi:hypothetical protein [Buchananella hordeovulneris]|uniref:TIGR03986 family CRISPR-associated RAMP protein n=1 Tax=Buchananella hordeovulneris TaxID=52770 RepID=A0A1Q5PV40_9ACTO|nr:hypothetical protein [Buchananella hordeovulneris]MDO5080948.1 hypothetical protein [Buchananella hordeovulneris]OKL51295.1 hypothetical protein BSZ40_08280 [Buchananella hordeovulneris]